METIEFKLTLQYISAWLWHLMAIIFLTSSIICLAIRANIYFIGLMGVFIFSEFIAWKRKREFERGLE